jgi:hypothetical protein
MYTTFKLEKNCKSDDNIKMDLDRNVSDYGVMVCYNMYYYFFFDELILYIVPQLLFPQM